MFDFGSVEEGLGVVSGKCDCSTFEVKEITKLKEKRKWMEYFNKGYSGFTIGLQPAMFGPLCRYFLAIVDGKGAGFIRITDYTETWSKYYDGQVWNASDAFVKKPYRNQLVLRRLLMYVIENCHVKSARLETERLRRNSRYYKSLGFSYAWSFGDGEMTIAVQKDLESAAIKRNADSEK
jgi:GNAT superfamily N-acetyltransferase